MTLPFSSRRTLPGFTLVELLTVIAIIAVLAGLAVGLTTAAKSARVNSRMQADLRQIQTAIESYKADLNTFPPDHRLAGTPRRVDPVINPLYYELRGLDVVNGEFRVKGTQVAIAPDDVERAFGRRGFRNASEDPSQPSRSYLDPQAASVKRVTLPGNLNVELLVAPVEWPPNAPEAAPINGTRFNPWRYVSTSPTNNQGSFDLWAEVYVGKDKRVFKNW